MKINKKKVSLFIILLSSLAIIMVYKYNFSDGLSLKRSIMEPDRIKIYYSSKEITIDKSHKEYASILKLNKNRIINPLIVTKFNIKDSDSFFAVNNSIKLSSKYNTGLVFPMDEKDINNLKMNINMLEYLYDKPQALQYRFKKMYDDTSKYNVNQGVEYTRILYTLTEGKVDFMVFGKENLLFNSEGITLKTSNRLNKLVAEM